MNLDDVQLPDNYREIIDRFLAVCKSDERILAALLGGSHATGKGDKFSDLDLFLITTDGAYEKFLAEHDNFIRLLGEPLFIERFGHVSCIIFANGAEVDIWFSGQNKFNNIYADPYLVLLDKENFLSEREFPTRIVDQAKQNVVLRQQIDWFWHEMSHFIKAMGRRHLWFAYGQIEAMRQICVVLARLKHDFSDAYAGGGEPYFKIEQTLPLEALLPLHTTFCAMEYKTMLQAALVLFRFYQDVAPSLAAAHELTYQSKLEQMMHHQLQALENVSPG
ncbi:aminoglycoside 6-adenylyltransferase [Candidatus Leptofilum sp.]|uniref:aminoglycoside 6-adenylyltransferase n=1 Tax=Candidatus Leptofilum sp. TaxID=3241576 RepID=UPI003B5B1530